MCLACWLTDGLGGVWLGGMHALCRGCSDSTLPWSKKAHSQDPLDTKYPYVVSVHACPRVCARVYVLCVLCARIPYVVSMRACARVCTCLCCVLCVCAHARVYWGLHVFLRRMGVLPGS